jgi:hypothetical protein
MQVHLLAIESGAERGAARASTGTTNRLSHLFTFPVNEHTNGSRCPVHNTLHFLLVLGYVPPLLCAPFLLRSRSKEPGIKPLDLTTIDLLKSRCEFSTTVKYIAVGKAQER